MSLRDESSSEITDSHSESKKGFFKNTLDNITGKITLLGAIVCRTLRTVTRYAKGAAIWLFYKSLPYVCCVRNVLKVPCAKAGECLARPFIRLWKSGKNGLSRVKCTYKEKGAKPAIIQLFKDGSRFFCGKKGVFVTLFNYCAPALSLVFLVALVNGALSGESLPTEAASAAPQTEQVEFVNVERLLRTNNEALSDSEVTASSFSLQRAEGIEETLKSATYEGEIIEATNVLINGVSIGIIENDDALAVQKTLDELLLAYATGREGELLSFADDVVVESGLYRSGQLVDVEEVTSLLTSKLSQETYYTVCSGDAPYTIAAKNNITFDELVALNPNITTRCLVGDKVILSQEVPYLAVNTTYTENYDEVVPYETVEVPSSSYYVGVSFLSQSGSDGYANRTAQITLTNGYETSREIIEETMLTEPVARKIIVGSLTASGTIDENVQANDFMWPLAIVSGEYISSHFGYRTFDYSYHGALDIACARGTPIYASADGYVSTSRYNGSYGNLVVINHGNGLETYYAHCSSLLVNAGTYVKKGDLIALVGSTGNSYGYHLHFEIRANGVKKDPINYLKSPV